MPIYTNGSLSFKYNTDIYGDDMDGTDRFINIISIVPMAKPVTKLSKSLNKGAPFSGEIIDFGTEKMFDIYSVGENVYELYIK